MAQAFGEVADPVRGASRMIARGLHVRAEGWRKQAAADVRGSDSWIPQFGQGSLRMRSSKTSSPYVRSRGRRRIVHAKLPGWLGSLQAAQVVGWSLLWRGSEFERTMRVAGEFRMALRWPERQCPLQRGMCWLRWRWGRSAWKRYRFRVVGVVAGCESRGPGCGSRVAGWVAGCGSRLRVVGCGLWVAVAGCALVNLGSRVAGSLGVWVSDSCNGQCTATIKRFEEDPGVAQGGELTGLSTNHPAGTVRQRFPG